MNKITKFFSKAGVALGALVGSIAVAVNIGIARAPHFGPSSTLSGILGTAFLFAGVVAVGITSTVVKLVKDAGEKQKLLGNDKNAGNKQQANVGGEKANKNIYSSKVNYSNRGNYAHYNQGAQKFGENFGKTAAQFGEGIGKGAEKLGEGLGRGAEKIGEGLNKFFSDSRQPNNNYNNNQNQGQYTNSYNARPNNGYYQANYNQNNYSWNNNQQNYNPNNGQYNNQNYRQANNGYNPGNQNNQQQYNQQQYSWQYNQNNANGYNQGFNSGNNGSVNKQTQTADKAATTNYFNNAPGDSQYRSGPLKQNATSER